MSSAEQRPLKRGMTVPEPKSPYTMTLPEEPEWRIRMHLTTQKSSGNKCTQRAGISVPREESTYAPSIRKMISPPREFRAKARRVVGMSTQCKSKHKASRNTKQVEPQSSSKRKAQASGIMRQKQVQKMTWKEVEKWDEASEVDQDQPKDKGSRRPPESRDTGCWMTRRSATITKSLPKFICLLNHNGNQQLIWV